VLFCSFFPQPYSTYLPFQNCNSKMKIQLFVFAGFAALISAQTAPNLPQCGTTAMVGAVSSSGCAFTDANCMCKNQNVLNAAKTQLPKACSSPADQQAYAAFFNSQCTGQPGFPITIGNAKADSSGASASSSSSSSGVKPSNAVTSGVAKPASTATSSGRTNQVAAGVLAAAAGIALFGLS